ncbi:unnamed protein product [Cunninghamella echinulata]
MHLSLYFIYTLCTRKTITYLQSSVLAYGKLNQIADQPRTKWASIVRNWTVPKIWFTHFYIVGLIFSLYCWCEIILAMKTMPSQSQQLQQQQHDNNRSILGPLLYMISRWDTPYGSQRLNWCTCLIGLSLMTLHLFRRVYESWYIERPSPNARMHFSHYLVGFGFYGAMVFGTWLEGVASLDIWQDNLVTPSDISYVSITLSIGLFIYASIHQNTCHKILASLRTTKKKEEGKIKSRYAVPKGDWFEIWVAPHYICDILIYTSLCILYQGKSIILLCGWIWTFLNLSVTAMETKIWYIQTFPNYPKNDRWIVIPGIF